MKWKEYRLYRLRDRYPCSSNESTPGGPEVPTQIIIKARNQREAETKALKISRDRDLQLGPIIVKERT